MTRQDAMHRVSRGAVGAWAWVGRIPNRVRIAFRDLQDSRTESLSRDRGPTVAERQDELVHFYSKYEELVELLCDASQYGPDLKLENRYASLRSWMQANYPPLRLYVVAYLKYDPRDAQQAMDWHGLAGDAFEALFAAPTLEEFLRIDDGQMIWRIERTRDALNLYAEHLRHLAAQEKECA